MNVRHVIAGLLAPLALLACTDNPVGLEGVTVQLDMPGHIHTLNEITYTATIRNSSGAPVTDFVSVAVERRAEGSETWRGTQLTLSGDSYTGTYTFSSSGEYDFRVSGVRPGGSEPVVLHEVHDPVHVVRDHAYIDETYRVEVETFPGHLHEGDAAQVTFWVLEPDRNAEGIRPPISGLTNLELHCAGEIHTTDIVEESPGVYVVTHTFDQVGDAHLGLHIMNEDGTMMGEAQFTTHVVHGH